MTYPFERRVTKMNHFIEVAKTDSGEAVISIHCGSRNLGIKTLKYWNKILSGAPRVNTTLLEADMKKIKSTYKGKGYKIREEITKLQKDRKYLLPMGDFLRDADMKQYLSDIGIVQEYAAYNRKTILERICKKCNLRIQEKIESVHNYIDPLDMILRKGCVRAYEEEKLVIALNMRDGIVIGTGKSNPDWNYTAPHGAGRKLSREKAK